MPQEPGPVAERRYTLAQATALLGPLGELIVRMREARDLLAQLGYKIEWHDYPMQHSACAEEVQHISAWLKKVFA